MAAITPTDLIFLASNSAAAQGHDSSDYDNKGGYCSSLVVTTSNILDDITGAENAAGFTDYKCFFVWNSNSANTYADAVMWFDADTAGGSVVTIGVDGTAASHYQSVSSQAVTIGSEITPPSAVTFQGSSVYTDAGNALQLGNIPPLYVKAVWIKRVTSNVAAQADSITLKIAGNTTGN